jgi:hypothetical protein
MIMPEVFQTALAVLGSVGIGGGIVFALSSWLGKVWAARILEEDRARFQAVLQSTEHEAQRVLERLKVETQKQVLVHRVQFETEFQAYREIWQALSEAIVATLQLRPFMEYRGKEKTDEQWKEEKLQRYADNLNRFIEAARRNAPFLPSAVANEVEALLRLLQEEEGDYRVGREGAVSSREYFEKGDKNREEIGKQADKIRDAIRERIGLLELITSGRG